MSTKHTAEPWVDCPALGNTERRIEHKGTGNNCISVAVLRGPEREANAARAVACVNACAGIKDPAAALENARHWMTRVASDHRDFGLVLEETREGLAKACLALGGQP